MLNEVTSSGLLSASGELAACTTSGRGILIHGITLTGGAAGSTLVINDNASAASGTVIAKVVSLTNSSTHQAFVHPIRANLGCYATLTGTADYIIYFTIA